LKIAKQGHRCAQFQRETKKDASLRDQRITQISEIVTEMKTAGEKDFEDQIQQKS